MRKRWAIKLGRSKAAMSQRKRYCLERGEVWVSGLTWGDYVSKKDAWVFDVKGDAVIECVPENGEIVVEYK